MIDVPVLLLPHNWTESAKRMLSWKTEILVARDGSEQRRRLRSAPVETLTYHLTLLNAEEHAAVAELLRAADLRIAIPRWEETLVVATPITLGDTIIEVTTAADDRPLVGDAVLFLEGEDDEIVEVGSVAGTLVTLNAGTAKAWPSGALLVPLAVGRALSPIDGETSGQLQSSLTIAVQVERDMIGLSGTGGESALMVPDSIAIADEGFTNEFSQIARDDIKGLIVTVLDASGNIIPNAEITFTVTGSGAMIVYPQGMPGLFNVKNVSGGSESVTFTSGSVSATATFTLV
jgi:hypothetical protein